MAKVTVRTDAPTPSQEAVAKSAQTFTATDEQGRTFTLKKPGILAQFRLIEMLGDSAANQTYMNMVLPLAFIVAIDGEDVPFPATKRQLEALIQRLDDDGTAAVHLGVREHFGNIDPEADKAAVKN